MWNAVAEGEDPMISLRPCTWLAALALLVACSSGSDSPSAPPPPPPPPPSSDVVEVTVDDNLYDPKSVTIEPGQTVRWILRGNDTSHTVTANDGTFDSGFTFTSDGATFEHTFAASADGETFEYHCSAHQNCCQMQGSVRVGEDAPPPNPGY